MQPDYLNPYALQHPCQSRQTCECSLCFTVVLFQLVQLCCRLLQAADSCSTDDVVPKPPVTESNTMRGYHVATSSTPPTCHHKATQPSSQSRECDTLDEQSVATTRQTVPAAVNSQRAQPKYGAALHLCVSHGTRPCTFSHNKTDLLRATAAAKPAAQHGGLYVTMRPSLCTARPLQPNPSVQFIQWQCVDDLIKHQNAHLHAAGALVAHKQADN